MATNLRLRADAEEAVRQESARTGRSQQELIREAVDLYLGLGVRRSRDPEGPMPNSLKPPRTPLLTPAKRLRQSGLRTEDMLERGERT